MGTGLACGTQPYSAACQVWPFFSQALDYIYSEASHPSLSDAIHSWRPSLLGWRPLLLASFCGLPHAFGSFAESGSV